VLDDHAGRKLELSRHEPRRREVVQVVERELAPVELVDAREQVHARAALGVVGRALVRVLPVGQLELPGEAGEQGRRVGLGHREPARDRGLVSGGQTERLGGEPAARAQRQVVVRTQLEQDLVVALGAADRRHVREVLRCCPKHRGPADVDHLDGVLFVHGAPGDDVLERVEVDADEVEGLDPVLVEGGGVVRAVAAREDRRMDVRVERLDSPAEQLGHLGQLLDGSDRDSDLLEERGRAAAGDELDVELRQAPGERLQAVLVVDRDQRAADHAISSRTTCGRRRCSTAWTRALRLSASSEGRTGTRSAAITGPESTPPST
jgi:hypothetical protein